jgi:hypothetical protein
LLALFLSNDKSLTKLSSVSRYFKDVVNIDPDQIWIDLCDGTEMAIARCQSFLTACIENSFRKFVVLGPEEYEYRRTLNSATSVTQIWRNLIALADCEILAPLRRKDRANQARWRLKFVDHSKQRGTGPVFEISKVCRPHQVLLSLANMSL